MGPRPGEIVIDDSNFRDFINPIVDGEVKMCATLPRDYQKTPYGSVLCAPAATIPVIPKSEWSARIKEMVEQESLLSNIWRRQGVDILDQDGTNYCWCFGVVSACLAVRAVNNLEYVKLSPASAAAQIKNFRNEGGWGMDAIKYIAANGIATQAQWPQAAIEKKYLTAEVKADMMTRQIQEWDDVGAGKFDLQMTYALLGIPVAVGYNHWSHEVCQLDPVEVEPGDFGIRIVNSWGENWSDKGMGIMRGSKAIADDAVAPRVVEANVA